MQMEMNIDLFISNGYFTCKNVIEIFSSSDLQSTIPFIKSKILGREVVFFKAADGDAPGMSSLLHFQILGEWVGRARGGPGHFCTLGVSYTAGKPTM